MSFQDIGSRRRPLHDRAAARDSLTKRHTDVDVHKSFFFNHQTPHIERCAETADPFGTPERRQVHTSKVVTPPSSFASRPKSRISRLSDEVVHFQKLVLKIESTLRRKEQSPEDQWRSRIMVRSAEEADREILQKLQDYFADMSYAMSMPGQNTKLLHEKLTRDYSRIHDSFHTLLVQYNISSDDDGDIPSPVEWLSPNEIQQKMLARQQEDFFVRAMREREEEVRGINKSMLQVNEIYKELGRVVETQQEKINEIEANTMQSRANAENGLHHVEDANQPSCLSIALESQGDDSQLDPDFRWSMPFETIREDMKSVQMDIMGLGKDIYSAASTSVLVGRPPMPRCASVEDVSDSTYYK